MRVGLCILLIINVFINPLSAQNTKWAEVKSLDEQSLPKSALEVVRQIYEDALKSGDSPELIKALIFELKYETSIDWEQLPDRMLDIERFADNNTNPVEKAILYSLLAELYENYYQSDRFIIDGRTSITGYTPKDIREWTGNLFLQKISDLVQQSLIPDKKLQATNVLDYEKILVQGTSSRTIRPTMYDFVIYKGIETLSSLQDRNSRDQNYYYQILELYERLFDFQRKTNNEQALVIAELDRLEFVRDNSQKTEKPYLDALNQLKEQYRSKDFSVEIIYKEAIYLFYNYRNLDPINLEGLKEAYELCLSGIKNFPQYERIGLLQNLLQEITESSVFINSDNVVYPGNPLEVKINYRNISKLTIELYKIQSPTPLYFGWDRKVLCQKTGKLVEKQEVILNPNSPYLFSDTVLKIPVKELGSYEYIVSTDLTKEDPINMAFSVSRLATVSRIIQTIDPQREFLVVDRMSGKPIAGAEINFYQKQQQSGQVFRKNSVNPTNMLGLIFAKADEKSDLYSVSYKEDTALITSPLPWISTYNSNSNKNTAQLALFTDRSIYRPGQIVYFKGIAYEEGNKVIPNKSYRIIFRDANGREITNKSFITNAFGSIQGEFVIPPGLLSGRFSIQSEEGSGYVNVQVEEYKRPTFDIRFLPNEETFRFGDSVTIRGNVKTFSGVNMQETGVNYRIMRHPHWLYRGWFRSSVQAAEGTVQTQSDGSFAITFLAEKVFEDRDNNNTYYYYTIEALLTDNKGETQDSHTEIVIGDRSLFLLTAGLEDVVDREKLSPIQVQALNLNGSPVATTGTFELYILKAIDETKYDSEKDNWLINKQVDSGSFESNKSFDCSKWKNLASGRYRMIVKAKDQQGREVENQQDFTLASEKDKRPPVPVFQWLNPLKTFCAVGENAEIIYGSSAKEVYVLYEIFKDRKRISLSRFVLNNENKKIEIPYLEEYGDGIVVHFMFIKDGKVFEKNVNIYRKQEDKSLKIETKVFRDRLLPGQKEEWSFSIKDAKNQPVSTEFLASMYDASLDKILGHSWNFSPNRRIVITQAPYNQRGNEFNVSGKNLSNIKEIIEVPSFHYDDFNWFGFSVYNRESGISKIYYSYGRGGGVDIADLQDHKVVVPDEDVSFESHGSVATGVNEVQSIVERESIPNPPVQVRQNFDETAFFYPQLKTNEAGETLISFTVPESNTTWNFMGLAHTTDLRHGQIFHQAVSQKSLMVSPNLPRFLREGDQTTIVTDISNLSDEPLSGTASLESFGPNTNQTNIVIAQASQSFSVESGKTVSVRWTFDVPMGMELTALKIVAQSSGFSDGEQHVLPVLPNRMLVTESLPLNVSQGQTRTFTFDKLAQNTSTTLENYRLTLEFASNPAWYAVFALPTVTTPQDDHVISWFAAYYSNALATHIANSTPKIKQMIDVWMKQGGTKETFLSNLEKNQELKAILLEETPWVMAAKNESEQRQRLSLLFDINRTNNLNAQAVGKLQELQTEDGGWQWFRGMRSSISITQWMLYGMGELARLGCITENSPLEDNQLRAIDFIDKAFKEHHEYFKKNNPKWKEKQSLSTYELEYLFVRSYYKNVSLGENAEIVKFYTDLANKYWTKIPSLYDRAIAAMVLQRNGNTKTAQAILKSLREHATHKADLGMFWANNATNCFMTQSATCIHTFIMKAFDEVGATSKEMDEMRLWLLKQKQTQHWESVPATINAIAVLLKTGTPWLESRGDVQIQVGDQKIDTQQGEAGTGYFKEVWNTTEITSEMSHVSVSKSDAGSAWGSLYWQYFEDLDKITAAKTELQVDKKLFVEQITPSGKTLIPVTEQNPLKMGDKLTVRLSIRTDRDLEYVLLKDLRASCLEPVEQLSGVLWKQGLIYYQSSKDASTNFFFPAMSKGAYVFEYQLYVAHSGEYSNGITTIQCLYAPEYISHTTGGRIFVQSIEN